MSSLRTGVLITSLNLGLTVLSASSAHNNPLVCVVSALLATVLVAAFKYRSVSQSVSQSVSLSVE